MNNLPQNMERFDAYLRHEMSAEARMQFEQELKSDNLLRAEFEQYQEFIADVHDGAEYADIRQQLRNIHNKPGVVRKPFLLSPQFLVPLALAASIALVMIIVNPFIKQGNEMAENTDYQQLHQSPSAVESETEAPAESLATDSTFANAFESEQQENANDGAHKSSGVFLSPLKNAPAGTAFLISKDGYFLTSKHLVDKHTQIKLQQKDLDIAFEADVVYSDSLMDFAILKCHENIAETFAAVPFKFLKNDIQLGQDVFTLGYPKNEVVYTKGVVSAEKGYKSDTLSFEVSLPANPGYSGAPLFTYDGDLVGIVVANNTRQQAVTYVLSHHYIQDLIEDFSKNDSMKIDMKTNYTRRYKQHSILIQAYRSFIFEVHL